MGRSLPAILDLYCIPLLRPHLGPPPGGLLTPWTTRWDTNTLSHGPGGTPVSPAVPWSSPCSLCASSSGPHLYQIFQIYTILPGPQWVYLPRGLLPHGTTRTISSAWFPGDLLLPKTTRGLLPIGTTISSFSPRGLLLPRTTRADKTKDNQVTKGHCNNRINKH